MSVSDPLVGSVTCVPAAPATLAPGAGIACTGTHTVTQTEVDAGSFVNTATINGLNPSNAPVTKTATATVTASTASSIGLTKSASPNTGVVAGTVVTYTFNGTNTGVTTLHNVGVTDPHSGLSAITCTPAAPATLAPGAGISCTATYTVTQTDVDTGSILNTATINGLNPSNSPVTNTAGATVTPSATSSLNLTKVASPSTGVVAGSVVTYTITGSNTGDTTLHNVSVSDPLVGSVTCVPAAPATLAPGAGIACTGTHTVTQTEVDAGSFVNTATINGLNPSNAPVTKTATATVTASTASSIGLTKSASPNTGVVAGTVVTYTFNGTNTGVTTLHNVGVTDPMSGLSALSCIPAALATLAPGAGISCTAIYTVTQADVDTGSILNTATINGLNPSNSPVTNTASTTVTATQTSTLGLTKSASPNTGVIAGNTVTYTYTGTNTGTVTLHNVDVTDPHVGLSAISCLPAAPATLAPGAAIGCSATYTVTQADVDAGSILNTGTVSGLNPSNASVTKTAGATVLANQTATLNLTKSASPTTDVVAGDVVTYTLAGQNTGTVTLHNVSVSDPMPGLSAIACTPAAPATLAPGAGISCTATYAVTQADVDWGVINNTASIDGLDPANTPVNDSASATVTARQVSSLALAKSATPNTNVVAGTVVTYTFSGQNTGTVTLHNVSVSDPMPGLSAIACTPAAPATLAPGAGISCTATYAVTQADVDWGVINNTASINGLDPANTPVNDSASATVTARQVSSLALAKSATPNTNVVAGTVVTYTFSGQNTGTVTLHNVSVSDPMPGLSAITCTPAAPATLAPGAGISCTATYAVTQADVDWGVINNTATIDGLDPSNAPVTKTASATVTASTTATLDLVKSASPTTDVIAGDTVTYTFTGTNTGVVTLHNVGVTDPMAGLSAIACTPAAPATLAPGAGISCTATYTVTQADVDAGSILNTATIDGLDPTNNPITKTATATVTASTVATLGLVKSASPNTGVVAGDTVTYTFTGTNTGDVTLHNVDITDPMPGLSTLSCLPTAPATLAPGAGISCTATYTVTQTDVDTGSINNTATINGLDPTNNPITKTASATVTADQTPALTVAKVASPSSGVQPGDGITYTITVTNTGTVTLHTVDASDPMPGLSALSCSPATPVTLAPNAATTCTATYTATQADVDAGSFSNTATATGLDPSNNLVTDTASATVTTDTSGSLSLTKTASPTTGVVAGNTVTYTMVATNNGSGSVHNVTVTDPLAGLSTPTCIPTAPATLASGATMTCHSTYTVTQADVDAGSILNTASVAGLDPTNNPVNAAASATVTASTASSLGVTKTASPTTNVIVGTVVTYTFTGTNTGATTLHNVIASDPMPGLSPIACTPTAPATLAPGATISCTATHTVTQADVDAGSIVNTATIAGLSPTNTPVTNTATATVTASTVSSIAMIKTASPTSGVTTGSTITYSFAGTNTGATTLHGVSVTDPMPGLSAITCTPAAPATLASGAGISCTATYTVTQADVDAGSILNTATIDGLNPTNTPVTDSAGATVTASTTATLDLTKTASPTTGLVAGDTVTYTFTGTNTGDVTLHNVDITDPMPGLSSLACLPAAPATLAPGATIGCTATYTVTQTDVDTGSILNTATIDGLDPIERACDQDRQRHRHRQHRRHARASEDARRRTPTSWPAPP